MIPADFYIEPADFQRDFDALKSIREPVFIVEQSVPAELEWDELDATSRHAIARDLQGRAIGAGRLTPQHTIGRMAVLPEWRGKSVGASLLTHLIDAARGLGYPDLELHSQVHAVAFYARFGFQTIGEVYDEAGIPHQTMRMTLQPLEAPPPAIKDAHETPEVELHTVEECRDALLKLLQLSHRQLYVYSRELDPQLFVGEAILAEVRRIATAGRGAQIRVLLHDSDAALRDRAQLIPLAQRLSSVIALRRVVEEVDLHYAGAFILNDQGSLVTRAIGSRFEGGYTAHSAGRNRQMLDYFNEVWERAVPATELRAGVV